MGQCTGLCIAISTAAVQPRKIRPCYLLRKRGTYSLYPYVDCMFKHWGATALPADVVNTYLYHHQDFDYQINEVFLKITF